MRPEDIGDRRMAQANREIANLKQCAEILEASQDLQEELTVLHFSLRERCRILAEKYGSLFRSGVGIALGDVVEGHEKRGRFEARVKKLDTSDEATTERSAEDYVIEFTVTSNDAAGYHTIWAEESTHLAVATGIEEFDTSEIFDLFYLGNADNLQLVRLWADIYLPAVERHLKRLEDSLDWLEREVINEQRNSFFVSIAQT